MAFQTPVNKTKSCFSQRNDLFSPTKPTTTTSSSFSMTSNPLFHRLSSLIRQIEEEMDNCSSNPLIIDQTPISRTIGFPFSLDNFKKTFHVDYIVIHVIATPDTDKNTILFEYTFTLSYLIFKTFAEQEHEKEFGPYSSIEEFPLFWKDFWELFWKYSPCRECLDCLTDISQSPICSHCQWYMYRNEYGIQHGYLKDHQQCPICFEEVYSSSLTCGHYVHKTCLIQLNPFLWFTEDVKELACMVCPLCRKEMTLSDFQHFFHYPLSSTPTTLTTL